MILHKKLKRDLLGKKDSNLAVIILICIGVMIYSSFDMLGKNLRFSQQDFYQSCNFADGFVELENIPYKKVNTLIQIDGVQASEGHTIVTTRINFSGSRDDVYLKIFSYDEGINHINQFLLQKGSFPKDGKHEILLDSKFARFNHLEVGDTINIIKNGEETIFTVCGLGASPEFIYVLKDPRDILPNYDTYGVGITSLNTMEKLSDLNSQYNNIVFTLKPGYTFSNVSNSIESMLKHYGVHSMVPRKNQISHSIVDGEVDEAVAMSTFIPILFLFISAMIQIMMLERLVQSQRTQIGILKAFGYTNKQIHLHYMEFSIVLGIIGSLLGILLSLPMLSSIVDMYDNYFNFPYISKDLDIKTMVISFFFGTCFSVLAGYIGTKKVLLLSPLEAFKSEEPNYTQKKTLLDKLSFLFHTFGKMSLRNISRNRKRSLFIFLGITLSYALSSSIFIMTEIRDDVIMEKYNYSEVYDAKIHFQSVVKKSSAIQELQKKSEITQIEPLLEVPVSISHNNISKDSSIIGVPDKSQLYHILDEKQNAIPITKDEVFISERLAQTLQVHDGDSVFIKSYLMKEPEKKKVSISKIIKQNVGTNMYMHQDTLEELLQQHDIATSLIFRSNNEFINQLRSDYDESLTVSNIVHSDTMKKKMLDFLQTFGFMTYIFAGFSILMCFIVIYNSYIININERSRELSSLLILGMSRKEVSQIISLEQQIIAVFGMLCGIPLTKLFLTYVSLAISSDMFTIPTPMNVSGFLWSSVCVILAVLLAQKIGKKKIDEFIIVEVLKERE